MLALTLLALLLPTASDGVHAQSGLPTTRLLLSGHPVRAEIADADDSRARGLMFRTSLPADEGMLFVFDTELPLSFWMKNTLIPLDMLYFDRNGRLVSIQRDVPPCRTAYCPSFPSEAPARYVLEMNAGRAGQLQLSGTARLCERAPQRTPLPACVEP
jgi:uncharacterized membrane protein (UPF0127 family)